MGIFSRLFGKPNSSTSIDNNTKRAEAKAQAQVGQPESPSSNDDPEAIMMAAHKGKTDVVRELLAKRNGVKFLNAALIEAAIEGHTATAAVLINAGADVNATVRFEKTDTTALIAAATNGRCDVARLLVEKGAKLDLVVNAAGVTALMFAALKGDFETVRVLVEGGASTDLQSVDGETAASIAASAGHQRIVELLSRRCSDRAKSSQPEMMLSDLPAEIHIPGVMLPGGASVDMQLAHPDGHSAIAAWRSADDAERWLLKGGLERWKEADHLLANKMSVGGQVVVRKKSRDYLSVYRLAGGTRYLHFEPAVGDLFSPPQRRYRLA